MRGVALQRPANKAERDARNHKIVKLYRKGYTCTDIAQRFGMNPNSVRVIASKLNEP